MPDLKNLVYPDLPILQYKEKIQQLIQGHPVLLVVAGTGSGKSTQLPKFCLEILQNLTPPSHQKLPPIIGLTQPRRLAATTIAKRLTEEIQDPSIVGCQTRFYKDIPENCLIKVMTDGILLQELRKDPLLKRYQVILLDEVHERSLQIDFLLGIFRDLVNKRPDFRLILASATMEVNALSGFFNNAPVIEAEGRTYPVEILYQPTPPNLTQTDHVRDTILQWMRHKPDHLLAFLPTERDILDLQQSLEKQLDERFEVLPLYSRLSPSEQQRVFHSIHKTKVVLATNIAETSLTIPGIAYVVDVGLARISRYFPQNRVQGLPIEPISQASAQQRSGRAGRTKPGKCIRLFSEEDFLNRPEHTEPEIKRSNLANVVLQILTMGIKDLLKFQLPENPTPVQYRNALRLLVDLGALEEESYTPKLTSLGLKLSRINLDVSLARMILEGRKHQVNQYIVPIVAGISIQDPRITPTEPLEKSKAHGIHSQFSGQGSDILSLLKMYITIFQLWKSKGFSLNQLRKICESHYLHYLRTREWFELVEQVSRMLGQTEEKNSKNIPKDLIHQSVLAGIPGLIAINDPPNKCYRMAGGREVFLFPGSTLKNKHPDWVGAVEVRATSRPFLNMVFPIQPEWIFQLWPHRCKVSYGEPSYSPTSGFVNVREKITYLGLEIPHQKMISYQKINPQDCGKVYWQQAFGEGRKVNTPQFHKKNLLKQKDFTKFSIMYGIIPSALGELWEFYYSILPEIGSDKDLEKYLVENSESALLLNEESQLKMLQQELCPQFLSEYKSPQVCHEFLFPNTIHTNKIEDSPLKIEIILNSRQEALYILNFQIGHQESSYYTFNELAILNQFYQIPPIYWYLNLPGIILVLLNKIDQKTKALLSQKMPLESWTKNFLDYLKAHLDPTISLQVALIQFFIKNHLEFENLDWLKELKDSSYQLHFQITHTGAKSKQEPHHKLREIPSVFPHSTTYQMVLEGMGKSKSSQTTAPIFPITPYGWMVKNSATVSAHENLFQAYSHQFLSIYQTKYLHKKNQDHAAWKNFFLPLLQICPPSLGNFLHTALSLVCEALSESEFLECKSFCMHLLPKEQSVAPPSQKSGQKLKGLDQLKNIPAKTSSQNKTEGVALALLSLLGPEAWKFGTRNTESLHHLNWQNSSTSVQETFYLTACCEWLKKLHYQPKTITGKYHYLLYLSFLGHTPSSQPFSDYAKKWIHSNQWKVLKDSRHSQADEKKWREILTSDTENLHQKIQIYIEAQLEIEKIQKENLLDKIDPKNKPSAEMKNWTEVRLESLRDKFRPLT